MLPHSIINLDDDKWAIKVFFLSNNIDLFTSESCVYRRLITNNISLYFIIIINKEMYTPINVICILYIFISI